MLTFAIGVLIVALFALRPFANKKSSRELPASVAPYFSSFYCVLIILPTLPFFTDKFWLDGQFALLNPWIIVPIIKGLSIYTQLYFLQIINKENTSSTAFWGFISLALGAIVVSLTIGTSLSPIKLGTIVAIGILGALFFTIGEGKSLSRRAKLAFSIVILCGVIHTFCDSAGIAHLNWYLLFVIACFSMFACSVLTNHKKISIKKLICSKNLIFAGLVFAFGDLVLIFSMQSFFPVLSALFLVRVSQSLDIIAAHHLHKEGKLTLQYFFGLGTLITAFFFYFS